MPLGNTRWLCIDFLEATDQDELRTILLSPDDENNVDDMLNLMYAAKEIMRRMSEVTRRIESALKSSLTPQQAHIELLQLATREIDITVEQSLAARVQHLPQHALQFLFVVILARTMAERLLQVLQNTEIRKLPVVIDVLSESYPSPNAE